MYRLKEKTHIFTYMYIYMYLNVHTHIHIHMILQMYYTYIFINSLIHLTIYYEHVSVPVNIFPHCHLTNFMDLSPTRQ